MGGRERETVYGSAIPEFDQIGYTKVRNRSANTLVMIWATTANGWIVTP